MTKEWTPKQRAEFSEVQAALILFGGVILFIVLFCTLCAFFGYLWSSKISCPSFGQNVSRPTRYSWTGGGCFVQAEDGRWFHTENYWNSPNAKEPK